jgi:hypothetical protein
MPATAAAAVTIAPETLTITWLVAGGIIAQLLILIVFLVRVAWWLSHRFTLIDATLAGNAKEIVALRTEVSNDIAGRKVVADPVLARRSSRPARSLWQAVQGGLRGL